MTQQTAYGFLPPEHNPQYKKEQRRNLMLIGIGLCVYQLVVSGVSMAIGAVCNALFASFVQTPWYNWLIQLVPAYVVGLPLFYLFVRPMPKAKPESKALGSENFWTFFSGSIALMMAGNLVARLLMAFFEGLMDSEISNAVDLMTQDQSTLFMFVSFVVVAPLAEELIFRKLIIDRLLPYSETLAVVTSGLLFGLMHGNFYQFFYATALGLIFGLVYVKTGRLRYSLLMHAIINFTGTIIALFLGEVTSDQISMSTSINPWLLVSALYSLASYIIIICGVILLIRKRKEITLGQTGQRYLTLTSQFKVTWGNVGTILFCVLSGISFVYSLFI